MQNLVEVEHKNRVATITLNRPEKRNALSPELVSALLAAFAEAKDSPEAKVVVLAANGKVFCAGADLGYLQSLQNFSYEENLADSSHLKKLFHTIYTFPKPVVAKVHGHAIAGGCGLATVCDFVLTVPEAKFGYTEVRIGFVPALVKIFLLRKIGEARSKELLLRGHLIDSQKALHYGLVNEVVAADELDEAVLTLCRELCESNSGEAMALTKAMIAHVQHLELNEALDYAAQQNAKARATNDCKKGIGAFLDKEKLKW